VSSHYARRHGGTGLGLAITKKIVASMGGSVSLSSLGTGQGATFCILIPLDRLYVNGDESLAPRTMTRSSSEDNIGKCFDADGPIVRVVLAAGPTSDTLSSLVKQCGAQVSVTNFAVAIECVLLL
jgi:hypothetical protein